MSGTSKLIEFGKYLLIFKFYSNQKNPRRWERSCPDFCRTSTGKKKRPTNSRPRPNHKHFSTLNRNETEHNENKPRERVPELTPGQHSYHSAWWRWRGRENMTAVEFGNDILVVDMGFCYQAKMLPESIMSYPIQPILRIENRKSERSHYSAILIILAVSLIWWTKLVIRQSTPRSWLPWWLKNDKKNSPMSQVKYSSCESKGKK